MNDLDEIRMRDLEIQLESEMQKDTVHAIKAAKYLSESLKMFETALNKVLREQAKKG